MPPKAEAGAGNEAFLAACVKCAKARLEVDFDLVAKATGMSKGGASNKFRVIMKQFEDEGAVFTSNGTGKATTGGKVAPKRKATPQKPAADFKTKSGECEGGTDGDDKPTAKRAKTKAAPTKKGTAIAKNKKAAEASASEEDAGGDEHAAAVSEEEA